MNESEVQRQIDQMVRFIKQEAEEKANEISVSAEEEFNIEKLQLVQTEKAKVAREYERRESQIEVKKKIEYSKQLNDSRIKVLQARENAVSGVITEAQTYLGKIADDKKLYKALLVDLLVQALFKLNEPSAIVKVREVDLPLAKDAIDQAKAKYQQVYGKPCPGTTLDTTNFLAPPPTGAAVVDEYDAVDYCSGGVVVTSGDGKIVCSNTLDDRLRIAYSQNLPEVRAMLFGIEAAVRS